MKNFEIVVRIQGKAAGRAFEKLRSSYGLKQEDAALLLGVSQSSISRVETGICGLSIPTHKFFAVFPKTGVTNEV